MALRARSYQWISSPLPTDASMHRCRAEVKMYRKHPQIFPEKSRPEYRPAEFINITRGEPFHPKRSGWYHQSGFKNQPRWLFLAALGLSGGCEITTLAEKLPKSVSVSLGLSTSWQTSPKGRDGWIRPETRNPSRVPRQMVIKAAGIAGFP